MTPSSTVSSYYTIQLTYTQPVNVGIDIIDKVDEYEGMRDIMSELGSSGYFSIRTLEWEKMDNSASYKKLRLVEKSEKSKGLMLERREEHIPLCVEGGASCVPFDE